MAMKIDVGAPSLTGKRAKELLAESGFATARYPLSVVVTNFMPRDAAFPEIPGLSLKHCLSKEGAKVTVQVTSLAQLTRALSSMEQVADLNRYPLAVSLEVPESATAKVRRTAV